jgi:hypothetical protein
MATSQPSAEETLAARSSNDERGHTRPSRDPGGVAPGRPVLAYILAASHSGSTLLAMLLAGHHEVYTAGELKATSLGDPDRYRCSCGAPIRQCAFWNDISASMAARGHAFDVAAAGTHITAGATPYVASLLRPLHRGPILEGARDAALALAPSWRAQLRRFNGVNAALVRSLCERTGRRVVVDSSKVGIRLKYLLRNPGLDVRVIRLVRDGRAVALTYTDPAGYADASDPGLRGGGDGSSRDRERLSVKDAAHEWRRSNEEADAIVAGLPPSRCTTVAYEDVCTNTDAVLARLWSFLGVAPRDRAAGWRAQAAHVIGNGMRFDRSDRVQLDDRWKSALDAAALATFDAEAGALNRRLGYI